MSDIKIKDQLTCVMAENDCSWKLEAKLSCRDIETGEGVPRDSAPLDLAASRSYKHSKYTYHMMSCLGV